MRRIIFNDYVDATLGALFVIVVVVTVVYGFINIAPRARRSAQHGGRGGRRRDAGKRR